MDISENDTSENIEESGLCLCGSGLQYQQCCKPYHTGEKKAADAETLMRSRYVAYAMCLADYLIKTTHRENHQYQKNIKRWRKEIEFYCRQCQFSSLVIKEHLPGDTEAFVTFEASIKHQGKSNVMLEKSRFLKVGERWLYHSAVNKIL